MSITSVVSLVAGKIGELLEEEVKFLYGVEDQVLSLQRELKMMQSFLVDMEAMYEGGDERSRTTIKELRKIAYEAEDVIESHILEASSSADKKERFVKRYLCFCSSVVRTHQMGSKIEAVTKSINETMEMWKKYVGENGVRRINDTSQGLNGKTSLGKRSIAYEHNKEDHVVGLDEDINKLVGVLTDEEGCTNIKVVVSIVGMGGSGKTTLTRKLFNHETIKKHFDCMAWVSVSQQWVAQQIILDLLKKVSGETRQVGESTNGHQVLVGKLHQYLEKKSYLIVLDDVWEEKALQDILPALPLGSSGGKIIVTTRNKVVDYPDLIPITYLHEPRRLNEQESWELFRKIALIFREETSNSTDIAKFEELGKEMLKKCRGLPLAVIALAGILSQKKTFQDWENVAKAVASRIMDKGKGTHLYGPVKEMLALSYSDLPRELKPCFLYLARYPEDYEIPVGKLIKMWIAEGFFTSAKWCEGETVEDVARWYLDELVHRCLVEVARRNYEGKVNTIKLHDLVRDLCIEKASKEDFLEIFDSKGPNSDIKVTESRRTVIYSHDGILLPFPKKNRYLSSLAYEDSMFENKQSLSLQPIHENFMLLRVLILEGIEASDETLPAGIGSLVHLRYLRLWETNIKKLPSSIGNLRNLLALDYWVVDTEPNEEVRIPDVFWKIEGLRHLYLDFYGVGMCTMETFKLHTLKKLETLKVSVRGSWMLKELPLLSSTLQKLTIRDIKSKEQLEAAFQCPSIRSDRLHSLRLVWDIEPSEESGDNEVVKLENILQAITHCQHLRKLSLVGKMGDRLSSSYGLGFPASIMHLTLWRTELEVEATLEALGKLPQLTHLHLFDKAYRGIQWTVSAGEFPQLKRLVLKELENLEEWSIERGSMPQLRILVIQGCKKLRKVPEGLKFINALQELTLRHMGDELKERIKRGGEDAHIIQHIPLVHIG